MQRPPDQRLPLQRRRKSITTERFFIMVVRSARINRRAPVVFFTMVAKSAIRNKIVPAGSFIMVVNTEIRIHRALGSCLSYTRKKFLKIRNQMTKQIFVQLVTNIHETVKLSISIFSTAPPDILLYQ